ncbi:nicotinamide riboside transporter PnuC [Hazenella coriacea]|uniref:Nicotinamide mononucleotide transporter n=1 Tax=Hazenella coriacea TaxID=1179467 RepID=A0A4R3L507_9BACL|nr:nicotinamide riboside transporter PnuC [Hazenella coriacea]TCS94871.1 nicotinamide mononucleotide transporter [Hazenella coriacea]
MKILKEWSLFEISWLLTFTIVNIYLFFAFDDTLIGLVASLTGMLCVVLVAKGKISNYFFGAINTALYAYLSYKQQLFGEVMLNGLFYFPIQFIGFYLWSKKKTKTNGAITIEVKRLTKNGWLITISIAVTAIISYALLLKYLGGKQVWLDSSTNVLSIIAQILMLKRFAEQWVIWIVINMLSITMWSIAFMTSGESITVLVMWSAYLVNSIYGYINWSKLAKEQEAS